MDSFRWRRIMRGLKIELAEHIARRAVPITKGAVLRAIKHPSTPKVVGDAMAFAWLLGLRAADLLKIQEQDVTVFKRRLMGTSIQIRARGLKGYENARASHFRWLTKHGLARRIWQTLKAAAKTRRQVPIFPVSRRRIVTCLKRIDPLLGAHSIRRGVATMLADKGTPMRSIQKFLGHASIEMTRRYIDPRPHQPEAKRMIQLMRRIA